jgi:hypothetical protein
LPERPIAGMFVSANFDVLMATLTAVADIRTFQGVRRIAA